MVTSPLIRMKMKRPRSMARKGTLLLQVGGEEESGRRGGYRERKKRCGGSDEG
jgi:hypothetical protein